MNTARVGEVKSYYDEGAIHHILLPAGKFDSRNLLIVWTVLAPRGQQRGHSHVGSEQAYIFIRGTGRMQVGDEKRFVTQGEMVYVPPGVPHSFANTGEEDLVYISAASPPFPVERLFSERRAGALRAKPEIEV